VLPRTNTQQTGWMRAASEPAGQSSVSRIAFLVAIAVKGIDGLIETAAGLFVAIAGPWSLYELVVRVTAPELDFHPASRAVHAVRHGAASLAQSSGHFVIIWLLAHGIIKLALAIELMRGRRWIFPVAAAVLAGFVGYMAWRLTSHWSAWLLAFALFDVLTIILVLNEWRAHMRAATA
jgi:uncharacterized membrane protein